MPLLRPMKPIDNSVINFFPLGDGVCAGLGWQLIDHSMDCLRLMFQKFLVS